MTSMQRNSDRLESHLASNGDGPDLFDHAMFYSLMNPEIAGDLREYKRLTNRQRELLDQRDDIERELAGLDERIEPIAARIREHLEG